MNRLIANLLACEIQNLSGVYEALSVFHDCEPLLGLDEQVQQSIARLKAIQSGLEKANGPEVSPKAAPR